MKTFKTIALLVLLALPMMVSAGNNDAGLIIGAEAEKKLNKKLSSVIWKMVDVGLDGMFQHLLQKQQVGIGILMNF